MTQKPSTLLINNSGANFTPELVQKLNQIRAEKGFASTFIQKPASVIMDPELQHTDRAVYDAVALLSFRSNGECSDPVDVIAAVAQVSRSSGIRAMQALRKRGHIRLVHGRERYQMTYRPVFRESDSAEQLQSQPKNQPSVTLHPCPKCTHPCRSLANSGWCRGCVKQHDDRRAVAEAFALNPTGTDEQIWATVQIRGKTRRARNIRQSIQELRPRAKDTA